MGEPASPAREGLKVKENRPLFLQWLKQEYGSVEDLNEAWRAYLGEKVVEAWEDALGAADREAVATMTGVENARNNYGAMRDLKRFFADREVTRARVVAEVYGELDPEHPVGVGSHQMFMNQPSMGWDTGEWARQADFFTTSIHLSWHFESVKGEVDLPVYLQSRMTRDALKGSMTSAFETTGGAVHFSGGYGNHMDVGLMRRLCFSYLAAGNQTMALWSWNHRPGGWKQGEYGMTGLSGEIMPWAKEAGHISKLMQEFASELWEEEGEVDVGLVESWDSDAILLNEPRNHQLTSDVKTLYGLHDGTKALHRRALIGAGRSLTENQVGFEYLTPAELKVGIGGCYRTLFLPFHRAVDPTLLEQLRVHVESGGRLVVDAQFAFCDHHGRIFPRGKESALTELFGAWTEVVHDGRTGGPTLGGEPIPGYHADLSVTDAEVISRFDDGRAMVTRKSYGKGQALLCAFEPSTTCLWGKNPSIGTWLADLLRGTLPEWKCSLPLTFRRKKKGADHFFVINPGPSTQAQLHLPVGSEALVDLMSGEEIPLDAGRAHLRVPGSSGMWLRSQRG